MASLYTLFRNAVGSLVGYAEVDLGTDTSGVSRRMPRSSPSDESGATLFVSANPGHVTLDAQAAGLATASGQGSALTALQGIGTQLGGTLQVGWSSRLPVDIGSATVTISGPVTISNEVEIKNDTGSPVPTKALNGVLVSQTFVAVPAFVSGNTSGTGGTNATVVQVLATNPNRAFVEIINNGTADAELWFGARPADAIVGLTPKQGVVITAGGGGRVYDARVPLGVIYATTATAGGLSVLEG